MLRKKIKKVFDAIVYQNAFLNRILRNINKTLAPYTSFRLRPYGILTVKLRSGVQIKMATNETSSVTKLLFWKGADQYEYTGVFEKIVPHCNRFLDIGANTGYYSLIASKINPSIRVDAFEPASAPYHYLAKNIQINNSNNITAHAIALSDKTGSIEFYELVNPDNYHTHYNLAGTGTTRHEDGIKNLYRAKPVPAETLDGFLLKHNVGNVDLIKIDTEGTEHLVLKGAHETLSRHRPIIICETLFQVIEPDLDIIMKKYGYLFFNFINGKLQQVETIIRSDDNGVRDCFFVHPDKVALIRDFIGTIK